ncbi:MAG: hypothetical protein H6721_26360 [Sandaracinus sp.]|nr:hypothetical protein [Sandaracinus sp.]
MAQPPSIPPPATSAPKQTRPPGPTDEGFVRDALAKLVARDGSKAEQAFLHWRLGTLAERAGDPANAVKSWLTAYNLAPGFRAPLFDLVRVFERRRSFKNLQRLYEAELKSARTPTERASARVDLAGLFEDRQGRTEDALLELAGALDDAADDPGGRATAGFFLERAARRASHPELLRRALRAQADSATDPVWKALLLVDLADEIASSGGDDAARTAITVLDEALATGAARYRVLTSLERLARRHDDVDALVRALDGLADLAAQAAGGEPDAGSGAFSVERFADATRAAGRAASAWLEAAGLLLHRKSEPAEAARRLASATALRPDDALLRAMWIEAAAAAENHEVVRRESAVLLDRALPPGLAAGLLFHAARAARAANDPEAIELVQRGLTLAPGSFVLRAMLDRWLLEDGRFDVWVEALATREGDDEERGLALWRAATLAELALGDGARARGLYAQAAERLPAPGAALRRALESAWAAGDDEAASDAISALLAAELSPEERSALLRDRVLLLARSEGAARRLEAALEHALGAAEAAAWAPDDARVRSAREGRFATLVKAHLALAALADDDELAAAHFAAAGRAAVRGGDDAAAESALREALDRAPGHRYATSLLEEVYRARGDADAVVALLREAAEAHGGTRAALVELLLAGAAAEAAGDVKLAAETYEEAADRQPEARSPLWALERLALSVGDDDLLLRAREGLSERELADGTPGRATLELGDHYVRIGKSELAEGPLRACLEGPFALEAAAALVAAPADRVDPSARVAALDVLVREATGGDAVALRRELGLTAATSEFDPQAASTAASTLLEGVDEGGDVWALLTQMQSAANEQRWNERAELFLRLAEATSTPHARASLLLHGLRAKVVADVEAADDAFLLAQELAGEEDAGGAAAVATDETLEGGDDPDARAEALLARLEHVDAAAAGSLEAAAGRALGAARRSQEAVVKLLAAVKRDRSDLASWEALRLAAREAGRWDLVVESCDALANVLDGAFRHEMREEAAAALMDHLGRPGEAKAKLQEVVLADPARPNAYHRMHDLLADAGDTEALLGLVRARIDAIDDSQQLERLIYEQARLHRSLGQLDESLLAIDDLLLLDEQHVGAIALAIEIRVQREEWREAVEALQRLAHSDVPLKQKRIAHLGAADFLENKLDDPNGALAELAAIDALGLADAALHERRAEVASRAGQIPVAADALLRAAELSQGAERLQRVKLAARLLTRGGEDVPSAILAWRQALDLAPTELEAGQALFELLDSSAARVGHSQSFERSVRQRMEHEGVDADGLRRLLAAARWREDSLLQDAVLHVLVGLGLADDEERAAGEEITSVFARTTMGALQESQLALLRAPADGGVELELAKLVQEDLLETVGLDLGQLGVGRQDQVSSKRPSPLRDEITRHARLFGLDLEDLYVGGNDAGRLLALPGRKGVIWVAGSGLTPPLDPLRRFFAGQQSYAVQRGIAPLLRRPPEDGAVVLAAVCAACEVPLPSAMGKSVVPELAQRLARSLPRKTRKAVQQLAPSLPDGGAGLPAFCRDVRRSAMRAGLLLSGDLTLVLQALLDEAPRLYSIRASVDATDLLQFWLSPAMLELRRGLGA